MGTCQDGSIEHQRFIFGGKIRKISQNASPCAMKSYMILHVHVILMWMFKQAGVHKLGKT